MKLIVSGNAVFRAFVVKDALVVVERNATIFANTAPLNALGLMNPIAYASIAELIQPAPLTLALQDAFGNLLTSFSGNVTVTLEEFLDAVIPKSNAFLSGNKSTEASNGLASFSVSVNASGVYSLLFTCQHVQLHSSKFTVVQDGITSMQIVRNPENSTGGQYLNSQPIVVFLDKFSRTYTDTLSVAALVVKLVFACENITTDESFSIDVVIGVLRNIEYNERSDSASCGVQWPLQPSVTIFDLGGNIFVRSLIVSANVHSVSDNSTFNMSKNIIYSKNVTTNLGRANFVSLHSTYLCMNILSISTEGTFVLSNVFNMTVGKARVGRGVVSDMDMTGGTGCEASRWKSNSAVECKLSAGGLRVVLQSYQLTGNLYHSTAVV